MTKSNSKSPDMIQVVLKWPENIDEAIIKVRNIINKNYEGLTIREDRTPTD